MCPGIDDDKEAASDDDGELGVSGNEGMDAFDAIMNDDGSPSNNEGNRMEAARTAPQPRAALIRPEKRNLQLPFQSSSIPQGKYLLLCNVDLEGLADCHCHRTFTVN